jgi:very-short-patch-repair endonuclease
MLGQANKGIREKGLQRALRRTMTDAERLLWQAIRGRQLAEYKFRRQHPFDGYILDFVCLEASLVVEVDGGQHAEQTGKDAQRTARLEQAGFRVLRFWNHEVLEQLEAVKERIWVELQRVGPHPHPDPLPEGEGVPCSPGGIVPSSSRGG